MQHACYSRELYFTTTCSNWRLLYYYPPEIGVCGLETICQQEDAREPSQLPKTGLPTKISSYLSAKRERTYSTSSVHSTYLRVCTPVNYGFTNCNYEIANVSNTNPNSRIGSR